jgi:hypothetical protein
MSDFNTRPGARVRHRSRSSPRTAPPGARSTTIANTSGRGPEPTHAFAPRLLGAGPTTIRRHEAPTRAVRLRKHASPRAPCRETCVLRHRVSGCATETSRLRSLPQTICRRVTASVPLPHCMPAAPPLLLNSICRAWQTASVDRPTVARWRGNHQVGRQIACQI